MKDKLIFLSCYIFFFLLNNKEWVFGVVSLTPCHMMTIGNTTCITYMFSLCIMTEGSIPGMSLWLQANTSRLSLRKVVSAWWIVGLARVPTLVVRSFLKPSRSISSSFSMGSVPVQCSYMFIA